MKLKMSVPCLFGLEGLAADELRRLDMQQVQAENGRVLFEGRRGILPAPIYGSGRERECL